MGQVLRRSSGVVRSSTLERSPPPPSKNIERPPPVAPSDPHISTTDGQDQPSVPSPDASRIKSDNVLEERDPEYDSMLSKMAGRITTKPGGKLEMGEAFVVERYNRPMPKVRSTKADVGHNEQKAVPPGTLNVTQLQHILLLHQGKADDHDGPMDVHHIAQKFRIDAVEVEKILQFISLPPEETDKKTTDDSR